MEHDSEFHAALAALAWQIDLGADEAIGEAPVNRYEAVATPEPAVVAATVAPAPARRTAEPPPEAPAVDAVAEARAAAGAARNLDELREALAGYEHCELKKGARSLVFSDGNPQARVLVLGEAPGRDEDVQGKPFVGRAGQLLDRMFAAIGLGRTAPAAEHSLYITNVMVWRPPQNRDPTPEEIAMMLPFVEKHIALVDPDVIVVMGNTPCAALLGQRGITRLRGKWTQALGKPVLPMFHPAFLLRQPHMKREAWADLLELQSKLRTIA
ncbi:uracil-DNA glycosylase [Tabrizicola sp. J26]|uniref:uracil-DNA glycosylase n=1 Tax=Alitabrizicola rongguiensis TaxID=2909234 RepID=UPI001F2CC807|nr:uracil-DNA glycosylase [Tabrizicola rongguiensis]MCF1707436.1 uracil-DNA glycosylase [Tabrizicola rongguiensis]